MARSALLGRWVRTVVLAGLLAAVMSWAVAAEAPAAKRPSATPDYRIATTVTGTPANHRWLAPTATPARHVATRAIEIEGASGAPHPLATLPSRVVAVALAGAASAKPSRANPNIARLSIQGYP